LTAGGSEWSCTIKLQGDAAQRKAGEELERQFGPVLTDKKDVELAVRRAQKAALNPSISPEGFLRWAPPDDVAHDNNEHTFTKTVVGIGTGRVHVGMALKQPVVEETQVTRTVVGHRQRRRTMMQDQIR
jgi:hypothetical protein